MSSSGRFDPRRLLSKTAKLAMTPTYERIIARAADSLFTNVITLTDITVGKVHYYGVRQATPAPSSSTSTASAVGTTAG